MIRNIVFDVGNVLTTYAWREHFEEVGLHGEVLERVADATVRSILWSEVDRGVFSYNEFVDLMTKNAPELETEIRLALKDLAGLVRRRDYAIPWIEELKSKGLHTYYLSNFSAKVYADCPEALDFESHLDGGIWSYRVQLIKPDPAIYKLLLKRYDLNPQETVFFDDTPHNVYVAQMCGFHGIVFKDLDDAKAKLRELGIE